eukprot:711401_1
MTDEKEDISNSRDLLKTVKDQVSSGNYLGVLKSVANDPPNCKDAAIQKQIGVPVVTALSKLKRGNIGSCLEQLDEKGREILLQYVFYGFQIQPSSSTEFLNWHQSIVKKDGIGVIVRVATNIKRNILVSADET